MNKTMFERDENKNSENLLRHNVSFFEAQFAFLMKKELLLKM